MKDPFPGKPKILFIALAQSTHTHSWVELLKGEALNVRVFGVNDSKAPKQFEFPTYSLTTSWPSIQPINLYFKRKTLLVEGVAKIGLRGFGLDDVWLEDRWLAKIIKDWQPDVIHTLGIDPASFVFCRVREKYNLKKIGTWVVTARGGPELALKRLIPEEAVKIKDVLKTCDQFIADNQQNYDYAIELGLASQKISNLGVVPGTGGVDIDELSVMGKVPPSKRGRIIVWPKAYECQASKALPVYEALRLCWEQIKPCDIYMTAMIPETRMWAQTLPPEILKNCHLKDRIPRRDMLDLMARSRVMLAPSLTDGIPNSLYEAMATNTFPIVSPLDTLYGIFKEGENVLFAKNLYPEEIAKALVKAMNDDGLIDSVAKNNSELVRKLADRTVIAHKVAEYYKTMSHRQ